MPKTLQEMAESLFTRLSRALLDWSEELHPETLAAGAPAEAYVDAYVNAVNLSAARFFKEVEKMLVNTATGDDSPTFDRKELVVMWRDTFEKALAAVDADDPRPIWEVLH